MNLSPFIRLTLACLLFAAGSIAVTVPAMAENTPPHCITLMNNGAINWSTGKVSSSGKASPEGNKEGSLVAVPGSAQADAARNIIQILKQIKIDASLTVGDYASTNDIILAGIEKTAQDAMITQQYYTSALDVEIRIETSIYGGFLQLALPDHIRQIPKIAAQKSKQKPVSLDNQNIVPMNKIPYTGLIIDARGLGLEPMLYPTIVSEQGKEIYSSLFISREFAVQYGICTYLCTMENALTFKRIGSHPLVLKALRKADNKSGALVISMADAKEIEKITERHKFLKECRVIIVADQ